MIMLQDLILLIVGAGIGIVSSIAAHLVIRISDNTGKLKVYAKIVYSKVGDGETWGCRKMQDVESFHIPLWIEVVNTANTTAVIRDFCIYAYKNNTMIAKMDQINRINDTVLANNGGYSFVVEPRTVKKLEFHFALKKTEVAGADFNELRIGYFTIRDSKNMFHFRNVDDSWSLEKRDIDEDWKLVNR